MSYKAFAIIFLIFLNSVMTSPLYAGKVATSRIKPKSIKGRIDKDNLSEANYYFNLGMYKQAIWPYSKLLETYPDELYIKFKLGICYLFKSDEFEKAEKFLKEVYDKRPHTTDLTFFLASAYHYNHKFDEAIELAQAHLNENISKERKRYTENLIRYCNSAKILTANPLEAAITNIGDSVNTEDEEYVPVISSDEKVLIFTYRGVESMGGLLDVYLQPDYAYGMFYEDIFITRKDSLDNWIKPTSIGYHINTLDHDASVALSNDGQKLFVYQYDRKGKGDIYMSKLSGNDWSAIEKLKGDVNSKYWEGSVSLSSDEKTLYFSSERPGGFGGKDIWTAELMPDGSWGNIKNMGPVINTIENEDAPFIHPDGYILHFSSEGLNSMGGYDLFSTELVKGVWTAPKNLGYPINTVDDDIFYTLNAAGTRGYYASGKPGGLGLKDIYIVEPGLIHAKPRLMLVRGTVTVNDEPVFSDIKVTFGNRKEYGAFSANEKSGKYLMNLTAEKEYTITYKVQGFEDKIEKVTTVGIDSFAEKVIDIKLYTEEYAQKNTEPEPEKVIEEPVLEFEEVAFRDTLQNIVFRPIYYNFDKSNINNPASIELNSIIKILKENPAINIAITSHTDCRGSSNYNQLLSDRRSESTYNYMLGKGIDKNRIKSVTGFGESKISNNCVDNISCPESEHAKNRRTEFVIVK